MANANQRKIFYDTIKIEITNGQYYLEDMQTKLTKALAKGLLNSDMYTELEILAKKSADPTYEKTLTVEALKDKIIDLELIVQEVIATNCDIIDIVMELQDEAISQKVE